MAAEVANNQAVPAEENTATEKKVEEVEAASKEQGAILFDGFFLTLSLFIYLSPSLFLFDTIIFFVRLSIVLVVGATAVVVFVVVTVTEGEYSMYGRQPFKWRYDF